MRTTQGIHCLANGLIANKVSLFPPEWHVKLSSCGCNVPFLFV